MKQKVLVFSIALKGYSQLFESCIETISQYSHQFKYDFILVNKSPRNLLPTEAAWLKIPLLLSALQANYEWVAFIDSDIDIRLNTPSFPDYLNKLNSQCSIYMALGKSGRLNSGVIFVRNTPEATNFLKLVLSNIDNQIPQEDDAPYENGHIIHFGKNHPFIYILDHRLWNNNSTIDPNSYIQHYSSGRLREWFLENRASKNFMPKRKNFYKKVASYFSKVLFFTNSPLSKRISKLMEYFSNQYPSYFHPIKDYKNL